MEIIQILIMVAVITHLWYAATTGRGMWFDSSMSKSFQSSVSKNTSLFMEKCENAQLSLQFMCGDNSDCNSSSIVAKVINEAKTQSECWEIYSLAAFHSVRGDCSFVPTDSLYTCMDVARSIYYDISVYAFTSIAIFSVMLGGLSSLLTMRAVVLPEPTLIACVTFSALAYLVPAQEITAGFKTPDPHIGDFLWLFFPGHFYMLRASEIAINYRVAPVTPAADLFKYFVYSMVYRRGNGPMDWSFSVKRMFIPPDADPWEFSRSVTKMSCQLAIACVFAFLYGRVALTVFASSDYVLGVASIKTVFYAEVSSLFAALFSGDTLNPNIYLKMGSFVYSMYTMDSFSVVAVANLNLPLFLLGPVWFALPENATRKIAGWVGNNLKSLKWCLFVVALLAMELIPIFVGQ